MLGGGHVTSEENARGSCRSGGLGEKATVTASYGSTGSVHLDHSSRCQGGMECRSQQDGALWLSEVGSLHR